MITVKDITIADRVSEHRDFWVGRKRHLRKAFYGSSIAEQVASNIRVTVSCGYDQFSLEIY